MADLPVAPVKRILKNAGVDRISASAANKAVSVVEAYIKELGLAAKQLAEEDRRVTVMDGDIDGAKERVKSTPVAQETSETPVAQETCESCSV